MPKNEISDEHLIEFEIAVTNSINFIEYPESYREQFQPMWNNDINDVLLLIKSLQKERAWSKEAREALDLIAEGYHVSLEPCIKHAQKALNKRRLSFVL